MEISDEGAKSLQGEKSIGAQAHVSNYPDMIRFNSASHVVAASANCFPIYIYMCVCVCVCVYSRWKSLDLATFLTQMNLDRRIGTEFKIFNSLCLSFFPFSSSSLVKIEIY